MQVILPRVQSFKNAKETIVHKDANAMHQNQMTNADEINKQSKQVTKYEQKEEEKIKDENKNKSQKDKRNAKKKKTSEDDDIDEKENDLKGKSKGLGYHRFDMKV